MKHLFYWLLILLLILWFLSLNFIVKQNQELTAWQEYGIEQHDNLGKAYDKILEQQQEIENLENHHDITITWQEIEPEMY